MEGRMTEGGIAKQLIRFSIPLILSALLQQLYSWADALIVGNFVGEASLAAIGATGVVSGMLIAILQGFSVGVSVLVAQAFGRGDDDAVTRTSATFVVFLLTVSLALTAAGIALVGPILRLLGTPADILSLSTEYLMIVLAGMPALAVYNIYSAALRGIGDSRTPLWAIVVSSVSNVVLDLLFVAVFGWGVAGAAIATVIAQALMALYLALFTPRKHAQLRFRISFRSMDRKALGQGLSLSLPTALQSGAHSIGGLLLQSVMNGFGTQVVAAITTAYRIDSFGLQPTVNIGAGVSTFTGQNKGAGLLDRARRGLWVGSAISLVTALVTTVLFVLAGAPLMRMFGVSEGAVAIGREFLYFCSVFYPVFGVYSAFLCYLQGMGDVRFAAFASVSGLVVRVVLSYAFAATIGWRIIAYSEMASWVYCLVICWIRYMTRFRHTEKQTSV